MKLAIVGGRDFTDYTLFCKELAIVQSKWGLPEEVISGGARGADTLASRWAREHEIKLTVLKPHWDGNNNPKAGLDRNTDIINASTHVIAFPTKKSRGTWDSIRKAKAKSKELKVVKV